MKQILVYALFSLALSSCKKSYTCDCTTVYTYEGQTPGKFTSLTVSGDKTPYSQKMTKKQAVEACRHEQEATQTDFTSGITDNGQYPLKSGESIQTSCSVILK